MVELKRRAENAVLRHAEDFVVDGQTHRGVFTVASPGFAARFITQGSLDTSGRPIYAIYAPADDDTEQSAEIEYESLTLEVLATFKRIYKGEAMFKLILAA